MGPKNIGNYFGGPTARAPNLGPYTPPILLSVALEVYAPLSIVKARRLDCCFAGIL